MNKNMEFVSIAPSPPKFIGGLGGDELGTLIYEHL